MRRRRPARASPPRRARATSTSRADDLDEALRAGRRRPATAREPLSIGAARATPPRCCPSCCARGVAIDIVTDQTSRARPADVHAGRASTFDDWRDVRASEDPRSSPTRARGVDGRARARRWSASWTPGAEVFDYGNSIRGEAQLGAATTRASTSPGSCPPTSGRCSARARARSAGPRCPATRRTSPAPTRPSSTCSPTTSPCAAGSRWRGSGSHFQGLPARICWLGYGERDKAGLRFNEHGRRRRAEAPDRHRPRPPRLRLGRLARTARPRRMPDGSDAIADWPLLNALLNTASRRDLGLDPPRRRRRHRPLDPRRPGHRRRRHRRSPPQKLERVLTNDPGMGVIRHVDAGYDEAVAVAEERDVRVPDA